MMTPVENGSTCDGAQPRSCAQLAAGLRARRRVPLAPVPALALPVLTTSARDARAGAREMLARDDHRRGAEAVLR